MTLQTCVKIYPQILNTFVCIHGHSQSPLLKRALIISRGYSHLEIFSLISANTGGTWNKNPLKWCTKSIKQMGWKYHTDFDASASLHQSPEWHSIHAIYITIVLNSHVFTCVQWQHYTCMLECCLWVQSTWLCFTGLSKPGMDFPHHVGAMVHCIL